MAIRNNYSHAAQIKPNQSIFNPVLVPRLPVPFRTNPFANRTCNLPNGTKNKGILSLICYMFSKHVTSGRPTKLLTCDASAGAKGQREKCTRVAGNRHQGLRSKVTIYRILLTTAAQTALVPGAAGPAQLLPRVGGRAPCREMGHARGYRGLSFRSFGRGLPDLRGERTRAVTQGGRMQPRPPPPRPGPADTASQGRPSRPPAGLGLAGRPRPAPAGPAHQHLPAARGARALPRRFVPLIGQSSRGALPPARPRAPGGARLTFPARPDPRPGPARSLLQGRTLQAAFPAPQPLSAPAAPPLVRAPTPATAASGARALTPPPWPIPPTPALARGQEPLAGGRAVKARPGAPRLSPARSNRSPSNRPRC